MRFALLSVNQTTPITRAAPPTGRREINWDGGGSTDTTTPPVTPFNVFLNTRGGQFTTPGEGLSQAPPSGGPQGGLAVLFNNPTYGHHLQHLQPVRGCSLQWAATSLKLYFLYPAAMGLSQQL